MAGAAGAAMMRCLKGLTLVGLKGFTLVGLKGFPLVGLRGLVLVGFTSLTLVGGVAAGASSMLRMLASLS